MNYLTILLFAVLSLQAEMTFPGNPAMVDRQESMRINPGLAAWQPLAFSADWSILNSGLLSSVSALQQGGVQVSVPRYNLVALIDHRNMDLLSETEISVNWAFRLGQTASIGTELGARHFGWNRDYFDSELLGDPVFAGGLQRWQPLLGMGAYWSPWTQLHLGLSLKRINQPSLALEGSEDRAPVRLYSGVMWMGKQLRLGLSIDNRQRVLSGDTFADSFTDLQPALQIGWKALDQLDLLTRFSEDLLGLDADLELESGHTIGYSFDWLQGDISDHAYGSHHLRYRYSLGGSLIPGKSRPGIPVTLPVDEWRRNRLSAIFGRNWNPRRTPIALRLKTAQIELLEVHVTVSERLAAVLAESKIDPDQLAMKGLITTGDEILPGQSGVLTDEYSQAWWQLAGLIEELAWDHGVEPIIHTGQDTGRAAEMANLFGTALTVGKESPLRLPDNQRLLLPDTLHVRVGLEPEIAKLCSYWKMEIEMPGGSTGNTHGVNSPPEWVSLALPTVGLDRGYAHLTIEVFDRGDRLMIQRELDVPVVLRERKTYLDLGVESQIQGADAIHLHLSE